MFKAGNKTELRNREKDARNYFTTDTFNIPKEHKNRFITYT